MVHRVGDYTTWNRAPWLTAINAPRELETPASTYNSREWAIAPLTALVIAEQPMQKPGQPTFESRKSIEKPTPAVKVDQWAQEMWSAYMEGVETPDNPAHTKNPAEDEMWLAYQEAFGSPE